ncbi:MAG: 4Fe-4S dicluster domain-containing protein [Anaerolineales bacterium]|nr:4Fe-4S dicluster domain-containing protein [Anaerolineales bacterium]
MQNEFIFGVNSTVALQKKDFDLLLKKLQELGYEVVGPRVDEQTLRYGQINTMNDLPKGYISKQEAGRFQLIHTGHSRYFDVIPGAQSWKQFLFPSRVELFELNKNAGRWDINRTESHSPAYAFIGVRGCELAAIQIQDKAFIREDFTDPFYQERRERAFLIAVNCSNPAGTCFCASMGTGPRVESGADLILTELDNVFLLKIGSELGRNVLNGLPVESASAFLLQAAERELEQASKKMGRTLDTEDLPELLLENLDAAHWQKINSRCLSCANCTQVCPTCFCWDTVDTMSLNGTETKRERVWDSCFNPGYSYQAGGNTRPTIHSRYRQWLSHKFGTWKVQYGTLGCTGCGRCITWCPAGIDITEEIAALRKEVKK